ncbi:MAG: hypothetical protein IKA08_00235 [Alphaproteobacteria bacterium]|nr:hypothetical protein [Alphaproteobacteria bacterium]
MNNIQNLLHSPEIQEKLHLKSAHIKLDADKKRQLGNAYLKLYFGLSCMNWTGKKNLGTAWQTAFTQMQNIINARDEKNPATQFLKVMHETHKQTWPRHIMTHPQRDATFNGDPTQIREYAIRNIRSAMGEITLLTSQCKFEMDKSQPKAAAKQPLQATTQDTNKKPAMSLDAKHKETIPQTKDGEQIAAKPGLNSDTAPQQKHGTNTKQIAMRPVETQRSLSQEQHDKEFAARIKKSVQQPTTPKKPDTKPQFQQATARIVNMSEIIRMQMLIQANQKVA